MTPTKAIAIENEINNIIILDKNENHEKILILYQTQKKFNFGMLGGFLGRFRDGKYHEILYAGKVNYFEAESRNFENLNDNKKVLSAIKQLNGNENNYMSILKSFKNPEKELEKITFKEAKKLVEDKKAEFKYYKNETDFFLSYQNELYFRNSLKKAYCI